MPAIGMNAWCLIRSVDQMTAIMNFMCRILFVCLN